MRLGPCEDAIMSGPWGQWGQDFFGLYKNYLQSLGMKKKYIFKFMDEKQTFIKV